MSGPLILVSGFVASLMIAYLVAKFSPNLWVVMIAILVVTALGVLFGDVQFGGIISTPPSIAP